MISRSTTMSILTKVSKTLIFVYFAYFSAIFGQISTKPDLFWPFDTSRIDAEHNSTHLKSFPVKTRDSILIKVLKNLIFAYFATFSAIFGQMSRKPDLFWPFKTRRNEAEHNSNHLKSFQAISS